RQGPPTLLLFFGVGPLIGRTFRFLDLPALLLDFREPLLGLFPGKLRRALRPIGHDRGLSRTGAQEERRSRDRDQQSRGRHEPGSELLRDRSSGTAAGDLLTSRDPI